MSNFKSISEYERINEDEAKRIFKELCELNNGQTTVELSFIRKLLSINDNNYSDIFLKFLTQYKLIDSMKKGNFHKDSTHNVVFDEAEFVNFVTGKDTKELLFEDNLDLSQKRFNIDDYAKLYELIGGNNNGINREVLKKNIENMLKALDEKCENISEIAEEQANEIIDLLGSNEDCLTPEDFMNIMTSNTACPKNIEDVL